MNAGYDTDETTTMVEIEKDVTDAMVIELADQLTELTQRKDTIAQEKAASLANFNSKIKTIESKVASILEQITSRKITEEVEAVAEYDYNSGMVRFYDPESNELLYRRELTKEEKQMSVNDV